MLVRTNDFDCWYEDDYFGDPWLTPEVIVIQHGFGRNGSFWQQWVPDLARQYRVIRRDMRAHGHSTAGPDDHEWTPETLADDVIDLLDVLDIEQVHYVGESVGGMTGIVLGARNANRLKTMTLVQTPLGIEQERHHDAWRRSYPTWSQAIRDMGPGAWTIQDQDVNDPRVRWIRDQWDECDRHALACLADATLGASVAGYLPSVAVPTLVLAPEESPWAPLFEQQRIHVEIPGAEIEVFEGRGHDIYFAETERCTRRLLRFIADRTGE